MNKYHNWINTGLIAALFVLVLVGGNNQSGIFSLIFGATGTRSPNGISADSTSPSVGQVRGTTVLATSNLTIGSSGTAMSQVLTGTCTLQGANLSVAATSTQSFSCPVTGVVANDKVFVSLATTSNVGTGRQWILAGHSASSTSGFIVVDLFNLTGVAASPAAAGNAADGFASTVPYLIVR